DFQASSQPSGNFTAGGSICNLKSEISNALALATDEHARHLLRGLAGLGKRGVRAMPAGMVGIVSYRASLAVIALAATGAMQHDLVRPRQPVFIDVEVGGLDRRDGRLADQSRFGSNLLQPGAGIAAHGQHG